MLLAEDETTLRLLPPLRAAWALRGQQAEVPERKYAYLPIVAGGTSFMYNLTVGGKPA